MWIAIYWISKWFSQFSSFIQICIVLYVLSRSVVSDSCDALDSNSTGSSLHGILQARILEWAAIPVSFMWKWKCQSLSVRLCNPMVHTVHGILQARILEWVAFPFSSRSSHCRQTVYQLSHKGSPRILEWVAYPFSSGSSWPSNQSGVSCIAGRFFTNWAIRECPL